MVKQAENITANESSEIELSSATETTVAEVHHGEVFYLSGEFWVAMAFVLVVVGLFVPLKKALFAFLGQYIQKESDRIEDAKAVKEEARKLLADYEQKLDALDDEAQAIVVNAKKNAAILKKKTLSDIERQFMLQEKAVRDKAAAELAHAEKELSSMVADKSISILKTTLEQKLDVKVRSRLIDESIEKIANL